MVAAALSYQPAATAVGPWLVRAKSDRVDSPARAPADVAMERYATGDDAAFGAVYDALAPRLYGYLLRQTRDSARAEDLVQQTLLHMHRARGRFIPGAEVLPWAFAIARRLLIDGLRRGKREILSDKDDDGDAMQARSADPAADDLVQAQQTA